MSGLITYGLQPAAAPAWKLFDIDGWQLLATACENDDGQGWGVRYSTAVEDEEIGQVSIWVGNSNENDRTAAMFDRMFEALDDDKARKALQILFDQIAPMIGGAE